MFPIAHRCGSHQVRTTAVVGVSVEWCDGVAASKISQLFVNLWPLTLRFSYFFFSSAISSRKSQILDS